MWIPPSALLDHHCVATLLQILKGVDQLKSKRMHDHLYHIFVEDDIMKSSSQDNRRMITLFGKDAMIWKRKRRSL